MKSWTPTVINEFGTLRFTNAVSRAMLADNEFSTLDNFNFSETKQLVKRLGYQLRGNNVQTVATSPGGGTLIHPGTCRPLVIQRRDPSGVQPQWLWFTDLAKTRVWRIDLLGFNNQVVTNKADGTAIDGAEWAVTAATPAFPHQVQVCRNNGGLIGINNAGFATNATGSPAGTHMTLFKDRLFMINSLHSSGQESRVNFCEPKDYGNWPAANNIDIRPAEGEFLVSSVVFNDALILFKNRSTWVLNADGAPTNWVVRNLHPTIGCVGRGTPQIISGFIYFLSADGVYRTDGTTFERISEPVDVYLKDITNSDPASLTLLRDAYTWDDKYILHLPDVIGQRKRPLVFDLRVEQWSRWVSTIDMAGAINLSEVAPPLLIVGSGSVSSNKWYSLGNSIYTDEGVSYVCAFNTKKWDGGDPASIKRNYGAVIDIGDVSVEPSNLILSAQKDTVPGAASHTGTNATLGTVSGYDLSRRALKYNGFGLHRTLGLGVSVTSTAKFEINSITLMNGPVGPGINQTL